MKISQATFPVLVPMSKQSLLVNQSGFNKERRASVMGVLLEGAGGWVVVVVVVVAATAAADVPVEDACRRAP